MKHNYKNTVLFFIFSIYLSTSIAQKQTPLLFNQADSLYIKNNIIAVLDKLRGAENTEFINSLYVLDVEGLSTINRKTHPKLWEQQMREKIKLSMYIINTLGNYMDFDCAAKIEKYKQFPKPPCLIEETIEGVTIARQPSEDEIRDATCKAAFLKQKQEYALALALSKFQSPIYSKCQQVIRNLELLFEWSSYTSLDEFEKFVRPHEYLLDTERKKKYFRERINSALEGYKTRKKSKH